MRFKNAELPCAMDTLLTTKMEVSGNRQDSN